MQKPSPDLVLKPSKSMIREAVDYYRHHSTEIDYLKSTIRLDYASQGWTVFETMSTAGATLNRDYFIINDLPRQILIVALTDQGREAMAMVRHAMEQGSSYDSHNEVWRS